VNERGFTRDAIAANASGAKAADKLNGRNIYERALTAIAMSKLALKYFHEYCPNAKIPSGKTVDDMLLYVRQKMFVHLKGAKNNKSNSRKKDEEKKSLSEEDMPDKWMFNGWFAFVLYGSPQGIAKQALSCLSEDGKDVPKESRAESRAKAVKMEGDKRRADSNGERRGVSMQDQLTLAALSQAEFREETKNIRELMALANQDESNALEALKLVCTMLKDSETSKERDYHRKRKLQLLSKLEELEDRKRRLAEESDKLREDADRKKQKIAAIIPMTAAATKTATPPQQISVDDTTTLNSSLSHSSSKRKKSILECNSNDDDEDEDEDDNDNGVVVLEQDSDDEEDVEACGSPIVPNGVPITVKKRVVSRVEEQLDERGKAVMAAFRDKYKNKPPDYGMDYMHDYN
jgi:hypothetical protein